MRTLVLNYQDKSYSVDSSVRDVGYGTLPDGTLVRIKFDGDEYTVTPSNKRNVTGAPPMIEGMSAPEPEKIEPASADPFSAFTIADLVRERDAASEAIAKAEERYTAADIALATRLSALKGEDAGKLFNVASAGSPQRLMGVKHMKKLDDGKPGRLTCYEPKERRVQAIG
jgi:hypothetical protein